MKLFQKPLPLFVFALMTLSACRSTANFSTITGKEWLLAEIRTQNGNITLDRNDLKNRGFGENIFSLVLDTDRVSGTGAPNRYFAPCTQGEAQSMSILNIAGTLMAPLFEPEKLKEHEFFAYLQNVYKWDLVKGKLELYTRDENRAEAVLVFNQ